VRHFQGQNGPNFSSLGLETLRRQRKDITAGDRIVGPRRNAEILSGPVSDLFFEMPEIGSEGYPCIPITALFGPIKL
jgi:hypothetical protein